MTDSPQHIVLSDNRTFYQVSDYMSGWEVNSSQGDATVDSLQLEWGLQNQHAHRRGIITHWKANSMQGSLHMASAHFLSVFRNWKSTFQLALEILQNLQKVNNPCHVGSSQCEKRRVFCCQGAILLYCPLLSWIGGSAVFVQCFCSGFFNIHLSLSCQQGRKVCSTILPIAMDTGLINPEMGRFQRSPGIYLDWIQHMFQHI